MMPRHPSFPFLILLSMFLTVLAACDDGVKVTDSCGDDFVDPGEQCDGADFAGASCADHGFYAGTLGCRADCTVDTAGCTLTCGDGVTQVEHEDCDRNDLQGRTCLDFGFSGGALACSETCGFDYTDCTAECGDGEVALNEGCDDGDRMDGDGCSAGCTIEAGWGCVGKPSLCAAICGDAQVLGDEVCDDGVNDGSYDSCMPGCMAFGPRCGDGVRQAGSGELCDGADIGGVTCGELGWWTGTPTCTAGCDGLDPVTCDGRTLWSRRAGAGSWEAGLAVAFDPAGDVLVTGLFTGALDLGGSVLTAAGASEIFLARFDGDGNHLWSRQYGTAGADNVGAVAVDGSGNIFLAGLFNGTLNLGCGDLVSAGSSDAWIAKFDASGDCLWSKRFGDASYQSGNLLAVDGTGAVVFAGVFEGNINLGGTWHSSQAGRDVFLARYASDGTFNLSTTLRGSGAQDTVRGLAVDGAGNVYLTGGFGGTLTLNATSVTAFGLQDVYAVKVNSTGFTVQWLHRYGATASDDEGGGIAVDSLQNVYVTGRAGPSSDFGSGLQPGFGNGDLFLLRLDAGGGTSWVKVAGSADADGGGFGVVVGQGDAVWVAGQFSGAASFDGTILGSAGVNDLFLLRTDGTGVLRFVRQFGGPAAEVPYAIARSGQGRVALTGMFQSSITFDDETHISAGAEDFFLACFQ